MNTSKIFSNRLFTSNESSLQCERKRERNYTERTESNPHGILRILWQTGVLLTRGSLSLIYAFFSRFTSVIFLTLWLFRRRGDTRNEKTLSLVCSRVNNFDHSYFRLPACIMDERADRRRLFFRDRSNDDSRKLVSVEIISNSLQARVVVFASQIGSSDGARNPIIVWKGIIRTRWRCSLFSPSSPPLNILATIAFISRHR